MPSIIQIYRLEKPPTKDARNISPFALKSDTHLGVLIDRIPFVVAWPAHGKGFSLETNSICGVSRGGIRFLFDGPGFGGARQFTRGLPASVALLAPLDAIVDNRADRNEIVFHPDAAHIAQVPVLEGTERRIMLGDTPVIISPVQDVQFLIGRVLQVPDHSFSIQAEVLPRPPGERPAAAYMNLFMRPESLHVPRRPFSRYRVTDVDDPSDFEYPPSDDPCF